MSEPLQYSNQQELEALALKHGLVLPQEVTMADPEQPLEASLPKSDEELTVEKDGNRIIEEVQRFTVHGHRPNFKEALIYRDAMSLHETDAWGSISTAVSQTASDLGEGAYELAGDALTLKVPKVIGSVIEGAAMGTKSWLYMAEEGRYNEDSFIHKLFFKKSASDEEYYENLMKVLDLRQQIEKDRVEGILLPEEIEIGGEKIALWNPAVVQMVSYVADPSWVAPNLGIESTLTKAYAKAGRIVALNEQLASAGIWASRKLEDTAKVTADLSGRVATQIVKVEDDLLKAIKDTTGVDAFMGTQGNVVGKDDLVRGSMASAGLNAVKIPAWGITTLTWGTAKVFETASRAVELGAKLSREAPTNFGLRLSERVAMESDNATTRALAGTWAKTGSPLVEWATQSARTSLHSGMYGGAFGFTFGGEEGFYNGIGSGFIIGGAFHQIGVMHNTVAGGDAPREVYKNFLWATEHYNYENQEGLYHLIRNVEKEGGETAKLQVMADIAASERLQRNVRRLILTEARIKEMMTDAEWNEYEKFMLENAENWGGVAFRQSVNGEKVTIINADRAVKSAVKEELFHTLLLDERYGQMFHREAIHALLGTEDDKGALFRMPKEEAVRLLEQFRDAYLQLDKDSSKKGGAEDGYFNKVQEEWNTVIDNFREGRTDGRLNKLYEEFLASYWIKFVEDKPIDYLLKGGDLGLVRNAVQIAKDSYRNVMRQDLVSAGAVFKNAPHPEHFFLDQTTKQRVRIPKLEKLMEHYIKEAGKEMYTGWVRNKRVIGSLESAFNNDLEHLFEKNNDGSFRRLSEQELSKKESDGFRSAIDRIMALPQSERGLKFTPVTEFQSDFSDSVAYSKPKKKKKPKKDTGDEEDYTPVSSLREKHRKHWDELAEEGVTPEKTGITEDEIETARSVVEDEDNEKGGWSVDKRGKFWKSVWEGNPRIRITGLATKAELRILADYLPEGTLRRVAQLNNIIEMARVGTPSNLVKAEVFTRSEGDEDGGRNWADEGDYFSRLSNFIPVELNLYFKQVKQKTKKGVSYIEAGPAQMLVKVIDHDAIMTRLDYAWKEWRDRDMNWKTVRRLFGDKTNLYVAIKSLMSRYSNHKIREGGIEIFKSVGAVSSRDAGHMRDIVNAIIGFHPTKAQMKAGEYSNPWLNLQKRNKNQVQFPTVMTDFNVSRVGRMFVRDGEGFQYDHENAFLKHQYNHSPAKSGRDHEGNPMSAHERAVTRTSVYRNRDGEVLSVYSLNKPTSRRTKRNIESVFDYVDKGVGEFIDSRESRLRGRHFTSESGWLHYTPDMTEASFSSKGSMVTGYIDTQKHIDISDLPHGTSIDEYLPSLAKRISRTSGAPEPEVLKGLLELTDLSGRKVQDLLNGDGNIFDHTTNDLDGWLFTEEGKHFFRKHGIHSVEYQHFNPVTENVSSVVALWDNGRFVENRSRRTESNFFAFSRGKPKFVTLDNQGPKSMLQILEDKVRAISKKHQHKFPTGDVGEIRDAFMRYTLDENGVDWIENPDRLTLEDLNEIIEAETSRVMKVTDGDDFASSFTDEERLRIYRQMEPNLVKALRAKMPFAPNSVLKKIAQVSFGGLADGVIIQDKMRAKEIGVKGSRFKMRDLNIVTSSVLARVKNHYQVSANKIKDSGIPMLAHIAEMSEADYQIYKVIPEYLKAVKDGKTAEFLANPENEGALTDLFGRHGGLKEFYEKFDDRQKDIFFLLDEQLKTNVQLEDGGLQSVLLDDKLKEAFAEKTRYFVYEMLKNNKMSLLERKGMLETWQKYRSIQRESAEVRARFNHYQEKVDAIIKEEFQERIVDVLTALNIQMLPEANLKNPIGRKMTENRTRDMEDFVRARLYDMARKGLVKLGSPQAIQEALKIFYDYDKAMNGRVIDTRLAVKKNILRSLREMEEKGFRGIMFRKEEQQFEIVDGKKIRKDMLIEIGDGEVADRIYVRNAWHFEGTRYKVIELADMVALIDTRDGKRILTQPLNDARFTDLSKQGRKEFIVEQKKMADRNALINQFLDLATGKITDLTPAHALSSHFGTINGPVKSYVLAHFLKGEYNRDTSTLDVFGYDNYDLYKNGKYFVAVRRHLDDGDGVNMDARIKALKKNLANGRIEIVTPSKKKGGKPSVTTKVASLDEMVKMRREITRLQGLSETDRGAVIEIDSTGAVKVIQKVSTKQELATALRDLKRNKFDNIALEKYLHELYRDFSVKQKELEKKHQSLINEVLGLDKDGKPKKGDHGNIKLLKELQARLRQSESELRTELQTAQAQLLIEAKRDKDVKTGPKAALAKIKADAKNARKNAKNALDRIYAIQYALYDANAFPEYYQMSPEQRVIWHEASDRFAKNGGDPNSLYDATMDFNYDWVAQNVPQLQGESVVAYASRLRREMAKQSEMHFNYEQKAEQLTATIENNDAVKKQVLREFRFLVRQFTDAKGMKVSDKWIESLFEDQTTGDEISRSVIRFDKLLKMQGGKAQKPMYTPDSEGVVGSTSTKRGRRERVEKISDLQDAFLEGVLRIQEKWHGVTQSKVQRINDAIERAKRLERYSKTEPKRPERKNQTDDEWSAEIEEYEIVKRAWEEGRVFDMPAKWVERKDPKTGEIIKTLKPKYRDANLGVQEILEDVIGDKRFMLSELITEGRREIRRNDTEFNFSDEMDRIIHEDRRLTMNEEIWAKDPVNRTVVESIQTRLKTGQIDEHQAVAEIKRQNMLGRLGADGIDIFNSDTALQLVEEKILKKQVALDRLTYEETVASLEGRPVRNSAEKKKQQMDMMDLQRQAQALRDRIDTLVDIKDHYERQDSAMKKKAIIDRLDGSLRTKIALWEYHTDMKWNNMFENLRRGLRPYTRETKVNRGGREMTELIEPKFSSAELNLFKQIEQEVYSLEEQIKNHTQDINNSGFSLAQLDKIPDTQLAPLGGGDQSTSRLNSQELTDLIERVRRRRLNIEAKRIEGEERLKNKVQLEEKWATDYKAFVEQYSETARKLGFSGAGLVVSPNNPKTFAIYNTFTMVTYGFYGTLHPLDWSGSNYHIGTTERGEQILRFGSSSDPAFQMHQSEQNGNRRLYTIADYMHLAHLRADWHKAKPDAPLSAEDALFIKMLVPEDYYKIPQEKLDTVPVEDMREKERIKSGILDNLRLPENRENFLRAFIRNSLDVIIGSPEQRESAYKRIFELSDADYQARIAGLTPEQVDKMLMSREVVEKAFYWMKDGLAYRDPVGDKDARFLQKSGKYNPVTKKYVPFATEFVPIQSLINIEGFRSILDAETQARGAGTLFDPLPYAKVKYESMSNAERMDIQLSTFNQLALDNDAGILRHQAEVQSSRQGKFGEKPLWFPESLTDVPFTGRDEDSMILEHQRMMRILTETGAVEASVQTYKGELKKLMKRTRAVQHLTSLDDALGFSNLVFDGGSLDGIDYRESNDGRYIIRRTMDGKKERFSLFFIGEKIMGKDGAVIYDLGTSEIGVFENTTEAQVMTRVFEDDLVRLRRMAPLVTGGENPASPLKILDTIMPRKQAGNVIATLAEAPAFSEAIIRLYEAQNKHPDYVNTMRRLLSPLNDFGEMQRIVINHKGQPVAKHRVISPSKESVLSKYFTREVGVDGMVTWHQKPKQSNQAPDIGATTNTENTTANTTDTNPNVEAHTKEEQIVSDVSEFEVVTNVQKQGQNFDQWEIIKNKLNYQIIRMDNGYGKRDTFRLFNPASGYIGQYNHEQDAVDEILKQELEGNE